MSATQPETIQDGAAHLARGNLASAEGVAHALLARGEDPDALHLLALVRIHQNRVEDALPFLERSLALRPAHAQVRFNLGKALALLKRDAEAAASFTEAVFLAPDFASAWYELGEAQLRLQEPQKSEASFRQALALEPGHLLAKLSLGVLLKDNGRPAEGEILLADGAMLAEDPHLKAGFVYNLAQAQYGQGKKDAALANFTRVRGLEPSRSSVEINRTDILEELGRIDEAEAGLEQLLKDEPQNEDAHQAYNDLMYRLGRDTEFLSSYARAPATPNLLVGKAGFLFKTGRFAEALEIYAGVARSDPSHLAAAIGAASSLSQLGRFGEAMDRLEQARTYHPKSPVLFHSLAATALQARDPQKAAALAEESLRIAPVDHVGLAFLGSAWRMMGDERDEMLNGYDELIGIFDLEAPAGFSSMAEFNQALGPALDVMHVTCREPVNQSLRGGSQTRGNIFNDGHEIIERLKARIDEAMRAYIAAIKPDARHPFRGRRGDGYRFTGSWSSRLKDCGYHINHVHPEGWISSCYYVAVPEAAKNAEAKQGWIKFGEPSVETGLGFRRAVQPMPGRLMLFPSYMWHGTIPFHGPIARTTIAFDAVPR
jgi:tetratricopeptide (TPR) repeat protein